MCVRVLTEIQNRISVAALKQLTLLAKKTKQVKVAQKVYLRRFTWSNETSLL